MIYKFGSSGEFRTYLTLLVNQTLLGENIQIVAIYQVLVVAEMTLMLFSFVTLPIFYNVVVKSSVFHYNLVCIMKWTIIHMYVQLLMRCIMMTYQLEILPLDVSTNNANFLLIVSSIRVHAIAFVISSGFTILGERIIATFLIIDYEALPRGFIGTFFLVLQFFSAAFLSFVLMMVFAYDQIVALCLFIPPYILGHLGKYATHHFLYWFNAREMRRLSTLSFAAPRNYSLNVRYQLEENMKALRMVHKLMIPTTVVHVVYGIFVAVTYGFLDMASPVVQLCCDIIELQISTYPALFLVTCVLSVVEWRNAFSSTFNCLHSCKIHKRNVVQTMDASTETDVYFNIYREAW